MKSLWGCRLQSDLLMLRCHRKPWTRPAGSGAATVTLNSNADVSTWLTSKQRQVWRSMLLARYGPAGGAYYGAVRIKQGQRYWDVIDKAIDGGNAGIPLSVVAATLGEPLNRVTAIVTGVAPAQQAALLTVRTLEDANAAMTASWAGKAPMEAIRPYAIQLGARTDATDENLRAVVAAEMALLCNTWGVLWDDWLAHYAANPETAHPGDLSFQATTGEKFDALKPAGSGRSFFEAVTRFVRHPLKVIDRVVEDSGSFIKRTAGAILDTESSIPWLSTFFLKPLGFHLQASLLYQVGNMIESRSVSAFKEQELVLDAGKTLQAAGQALLIAAPFLPAPYNVAAAALGALSMAAGTAIISVNSATMREKQAAANQQAQQQGEAATAQANYEAQVAASQLAQGRAQGLVEAGQYQQGWVTVSDGVQYYVTMVPKDGEMVPAWVWLTDRGWVWTGAYS